MVDLTGQFDEARVDAVFLGLPGQIERVDGDAVTAETWTRLVRREAEGLGCRSANDFVYIDAHLVGDDLHLVDQANVHRAVDVLQQLGHLCCTRAAHRNQGANGTAIDGLAKFQAAWRHAANYLGDVMGAVAGIARVFAFRGKHQSAIFTRNKAVVGQAWGQHFVRGAWPGSAFQAQQLARAKVGSIDSTVLMTKLRSGSRWLFSGVGTQMIRASASAVRAKSVVASSP